MYLALFVAILAVLVVIYLPGYFLNRALNLSRFAALATAPLTTGLCLTLLGIVLAKLQIACNPTALFLGTVAIGVAAFAAAAALTRRKSAPAASSLIDCGSWRRLLPLALLYVAIASFICILVFVLPIDGPFSFSRNDDTAVHLSVIRTFIDTGFYSTLNASAYYDLGIPGGFYPAEWHIIVAIAASWLGDSVALATNGATIAFTALSFPLIVLMFFSQVFKGDNRTVAFGALFPAAFSGFPWGFLVFGQLFPNMISFMFVPAAMTFFIALLQKEARANRIRAASLLIISLGAIAFGQPNGVFTFGIWAAIYLFFHILSSQETRSKFSLPKRIAFTAVLLAGSLLAWAALYYAPFLQNIVQTTWEAPYSLSKAFRLGVVLMFSERQGAQVLLAAVVLLGAVRTIKDRSHCWLTLSYLIALVIFAFDAGTDGMLKHLLSGFWYTDYNRTGAMVALFAMPLGAYGIAWLFEGLSRLVQRLRLEQPTIRVVSKACACVLSALLIASLFSTIKIWAGSMHSFRPGFDEIQKQITMRYSWKRTYTDDESQFVKQVLEIVPPRSLVINTPSDGSAWSYGVDGINVLFRRSSNVGGTATAEESALIRTQLCNIASSSDVKAAVEKLNAKYVLILDDKSSEKRTTTSLRYKEKDWRGIESITPETPGFTLILSDGDKRLYRIDIS